MPTLSVPRVENPSSLTPRQRDIVILLAAGKTCKQAAAHLDIAIGTCELHLQCARRRLNCTTSAHLVAKAGRLGLI